MNLNQLQSADHRRSLLWFLLYDSDYQLSETLLQQCFEMHGKPLSFDMLKTHGAWLCEQGYTTATNQGGVDCLTLTDRGLDVAKGVVRAVGIRDLRPSELADIRAFKGY